MKTFLALFLLAFLALPDFARADTDLDAADQAYQAGRYDDSAQLFEQLIALRGYSAPLCFDLGNAEFKAGHLGMALLNYERARYLAPGDSGINHNLQIARHQAGLDPDPYRWWQVVIRSIDWTVWLGIIFACLVLLFIAIIGTTVGRRTTAKGATSRAQKIFKAIFFICIPLFLFFGFVELSALGFGDRIEGVIVSNGATLRLSPFESAEKTGFVPEGELVTVEQRHDNYFWIDDRSRQSGWVEAKDLAPVVPGSFEPKH